MKPLLPGGYFVEFARGNGFLQLATDFRDPSLEARLNILICLTLFVILLLFAQFLPELQCFLLVEHSRLDGRLKLGPDLLVEEVTPLLMGGCLVDFAFLDGGLNLVGNGVDPFFELVPSLFALMLTLFILAPVLQRLHHSRRLLQ